MPAPILPQNAQRLPENHRRHRSGSLHPGNITSGRILEGGNPLPPRGPVFPDSPNEPGDL